MCHDLPLWDGNIRLVGWALTRAGLALLYLQSKQSMGLSLRGSCSLLFWWYLLSCIVWWRLITCSFMHFLHFSTLPALYFLLLRCPGWECLVGSFCDLFSLFPTCLTFVVPHFLFSGGIHSHCPFCPLLTFVAWRQSVPVVVHSFSLTAFPLPATTCSLTVSFLYIWSIVPLHCFDTFRGLHDNIFWSLSREAYHMMHCLIHHYWLF